MNEVSELLEALKQKEKLVAMVAPSFPIVFDYLSIISRLRQLGFNAVVEVALGAQTTNAQLQLLLKQNPKGRYITSPCPTVVRMVRQQMPKYAKFFPTTVFSPMVNTARIVADKYPGHRPVFIGPCIVKKLEAKEDFPELNILVITYNELNQLFNQLQIGEEGKAYDHFDLASPGMTRTYAIDGGLTYSAGLGPLAEKGQAKIVSGWAHCQQTIKDFAKDDKVKLLDILFCEGGCVNGPGIKSDLTLTQRAEKINQFWQQN